MKEFKRWFYFFIILLSLGMIHWALPILFIGIVGFIAQFYEEP